MNVWIFVISALFTPVVAPLGISMEDATSAEFIQPAPGPAAATAPATIELEDEPRYHGIERLFAELEAGQNR